MRKIGDLQKNISRNLMRYSCRGSRRMGYIYFSNAKAACSTVQATMLQYEKNLGLHDRSLIDGRNVDGYEYFNNHESIYCSLSDYYKFTFVRNPYTRILSAYLDKMINREDNVHKLFFERFPKANRNLSFEEFLSCIEETYPEQMDPHWRPQIYNIMYGFIPYDFIGFMECMNEDFGVVCKNIFGDSSSIVQIMRHSVNAINKCNHYYNDNCIGIVNRIYHDDFACFDYEMNIESVEKAPNVKPISRFNDRIISALARASLDFDSGLFQKSASQFEELVSEIPENPSVRELWVEALLRIEDYDRAVEQAKRIDEIEPRLCRSSFLIKKIERTKRDNTKDDDGWKSIVRSAKRKLWIKWEPAH